MTTCKRGHERTPENYRERTANVGGKPRIVRECLACARELRAARKALPDDSVQPEPS